MANNILVTEGSGKTVSTEDIAGAQYQRIKIVGGETGSTSVLGVTSDGAMKVAIYYAPNASLVSGVTSIITSTSQTSVAFPKFGTVVSLEMFLHRLRLIFITRLQA